MDRSVRPRRRRQCDKERDDEILENSRKHYIEVGLQRSETKAFDRQYSFIAWGTHVDNQIGRVGVQLEKLCMICSLVVSALGCPVFSRKALQQLLGQFPHPMRKEVPQPP